MNHAWPDSVSETLGLNRYGCVKLPRRPRSSDDHLPSTVAVRAPPKKFTCFHSRLAAEVFFGSVAGAQLDLPVLGLGDRDLHRHEAVGHLLALQRHGRELEESELVQPPLAQLNGRQAEAVSRLERKRARG